MVPAGDTPIEPMAIVVVAPVKDIEFPATATKFIQLSKDISAGGGLNKKID
jgi:hypothetical protein